MGTRWGREGGRCGIAAMVAAALAHCGGVPAETRAVAVAGAPLGPTASAHGATDATDAGVPDAESPDADVASRAILRVGWIAGTASLFVVDAEGVSRVEPGGGAGGGGRCPFPSGASVMGVSDGGRVALNLGGRRPGEVGVPNLEVGLSADGAGLVWRHGRNGTWMQHLDTCARPSPSEAGSSSNESALVSPHQRYMVDCPYRMWGTETPVRGFVVRSLPGGRVVSHLAPGVLADDDYGHCNAWVSTFSHDDERLAFADGGRIRVVSLHDGRQRLQIGRVTLDGTLGEEIRGLAFSPRDDALAVWGDRRAVVVDLRAYEAYLHGPAATYEAEQAARDRAVQTVPTVGVL